MPAFDAVTERALPSRQVTSLHLLRHGEVDTGGARLAYGHLDLPLTPKGEAEGEALRRHVLERLPRPDGVISSDLSRCRALAERIAADLDLPLWTTPALREQRMGAWEGRSWEALTAEDEPKIQAYWASYLTAAPPDGESFAELAARAQGFFDEHQTTLAGRRWVVVTHIGVIRAVLCRELRLPLAEALRFAPARGSHTQLLIAEAGAVLEQLGERPTPAPAPPRPHGARPRVALSGSAGVGKSTLGAALAQRWGVPFLPEGMRARIEAGLKLHDLDHDQLQSLIEALWDEQAAAEAEAIAQFGGFVADRSSLDYAAFYLHYGFTTDQARIGRFFERLSAHAQSYDAVLLLPYGVLPLVEDGVRSTNPYIQLRYQVTLAGLLRQHLPEERLLIMPPLTVLEARLRWAVSRCTPEDPNPAPTDKTFIHV